VVVETEIAEEAAAATGGQEAVAEVAVGVAAASTVPRHPPSQRQEHQTQRPQARLLAWPVRTQPGYRSHIATFTSISSAAQRQWTFVSLSAACGCPGEHWNTARIRQTASFGFLVSRARPYQRVRFVHA
jgi:hypothetical protein